MQNNLYLYPNLVEVRKNTLTQAELAEQIGITRQEISRYERGEIKAPISYIIDVAKICGVSVDYILGLCEEKNASPLPSDNDEKDEKNDANVNPISMEIRGSFFTPTILGEGLTKPSVKPSGKHKFKRLSKDELDLIELYRSLSPPNKIRLTERALALAEADDKK